MFSFYYKQFFNDFLFKNIIYLQQEINKTVLKLKVYKTPCIEKLNALKKNCYKTFKIFNN